jgi:hypothetical protein
MIVWSGLLFLATAAAGWADDDIVDPYLFRKGDSVVVRLDLSGIISAARVDQIKEGIDMLLTWEIKLVVPRRLWGSSVKATASGSVRLGYRSMTEDFLAALSGGPDAEARRFFSLAGLHQFLSDSIVEPLALIDSLDGRRKHQLRGELTIISLTHLQLLSERDSDTNNQSPVSYLFDQFLKLTNYGREECSFRSRSFRLEEIKLQP